MNDQIRLNSVKPACDSGWMCPHRGLVQFPCANLTQVSCPGPPLANKSLGQDIPGNMQTLSVHHCWWWGIYAAFAPRLVPWPCSLWQACGCGRTKRSPVEEHPPSPETKHWPSTVLSCAGIFAKSSQGLDKHQCPCLEKLEEERK